MKKYYKGEGTPHPLGVSYDPVSDSCNFALYSKSAAKVSL
jgi:pullulanase/glycogen debranching enzyme